MGSFSGIALYNNPGMKYLLQPRYKVLRHGIYIGLVLLFWVMFGWRYLAGGTWAVLELAAYAFSYLVIIYFNFLVLMPQYLYKNKVWQFIVLTYATFLLGYAIQHAIYANSWNDFLTLFNFDGPRIRDIVINGITFLLFCGIGWAFSMFKMWLTNENKIVELENKKLVAELSNLKHQLNPHFLFNVFNSLYVSSKTTPHLVPEMILDLSDLMRYQLEECTKEKVNLDDEIAYIKNFIGIERLRKEDADIRFEIDGSTANMQIAPLLFISLIENAFKHGLEKIEKGYVFITVSTRNGCEVYLKVINSKPPVNKQGKTPGYGIGLSNLAKRLKLGYPGKHKLELTENKDTYTAYLELITE
jgi:two-component system, LytTR family, sensor kinase